MTENVLDIKTIWIRRTDKRADRVLLFEQMNKKKKSRPFAFLKRLCYELPCLFGTYHSRTNPRDTKAMARAKFAPANKVF